MKPNNILTSQGTLFFLSNPCKNARCLYGGYPALPDSSAKALNILSYYLGVICTQFSKHDITELPYKIKYFNESDGVCCYRPLRSSVMDSETYTLAYAPHLGINIFSD